MLPSGVDLVRKAPLKKRLTRSSRPRSNVDPARASLAALERIRHVLVQSGYEERLGAPLTDEELDAQREAFGTALPASYVAAMRIAGQIGAPERFLRAHEIADQARKLQALGGARGRYAPFCVTDAGAICCFDKETPAREVPASGITNTGRELAIVAFAGGSPTMVGAHFGEWLDALADAREEAVAEAAEMPPRLKRLLYELGFRFEYPLLGKLDTGDGDAVAALIGDAFADEVRGPVGRLFDASGRASLTLNVDDFSLVVTLRTGAYIVDAEDVFRWLRTFRDENFWADEEPRESSPADRVRDLRRAPAEPPLVVRGTIYLPTMPARNYVFLDASGASVDDFYLLGRAVDGAARGPSAVLHVVDGFVATAHAVSEPIEHLYVARDGGMWGLAKTHAVCFTGGRVRTYPLRRPTPGRPRWRGIGGAADRIVVWGDGALLEFDGHGFVPFEPDAGLDTGESVLAFVARRKLIAMLVAGESIGAVARFDGRSWEPVDEGQVIEGPLADLDVFHDETFVLASNGAVWTVFGGVPEPRPFDPRHSVYLDERGAPRTFHAVLAYANGVLLASDGAVVALREDRAPVLHVAANTRAPVRLARVGGGAGSLLHTSDGLEPPGIVALAGPNVWLFHEHEFTAVDMREW